ncbi:MAG TPA: maleylpyruvate isomerase N-terminal domain-containing protein [Acidimicrobiales bacterium]|nr:maleylpyruvate isomerase N-terminal domain-containing protein [Acidimicrobiales bacterium]
MTTPVDEQERSRLCDLLTELGPDAPTLCEGWTTADLAAHLVLREHFKKWPKERLAAEKAKGFTMLVGRIRDDTPLIPWRVPGVRVLLNGLEYFIHHEDVRRANGLQPRTDTTELHDLCWRMTGFVGRRVARGIHPLGLELKSTDGRVRSFGSGKLATLSGPPTELVLYLSGRRSTAQVELGGSPEAVQAMESSRSGL